MIFTDPLELEPSLLAHLTFAGKPVPARRNKGILGNFYNARNAYIMTQKWKAKLQYREPPYDGAVRIDYFFGFPIPKKWTKAEKELAAQGGMPYPHKPDYDNLKKTYNDIIKNIVVSDDARFTEGKWRKEYTENPRTEIWLYYG